jgi:hypothetical protein
MDIDCCSDENDLDTSSSTSEAVVPKVFEEWDDEHGIPNDVLYLICSYLTPTDIWCRVRYVCISWHKRAVSDVVWNDIYIKTWAKQHKSTGIWWQLYEERIRILGSMIDKKQSIHKVESNTLSKKTSLKDFYVALRDRVKKATNQKSLTEKEQKSLRNLRKLSAEKVHISANIFLTINSPRISIQKTNNCYSTHVEKY